MHNWTQIDVMIEIKWPQILNASHSLKKVASSSLNIRKEKVASRSLNIRKEEVASDEIQFTGWRQ